MLVLCLFVLLVIEPRALSMLEKHSTTMNRTVSAILLKRLFSGLLSIKPAQSSSQFSKLVIRGGLSQFWEQQQATLREAGYAGLLGGSRIGGGQAGMTGPILVCPGSF
jgi:hypothetical protein